MYSLFKWSQKGDGLSLVLSNFDFEYSVQSARKSGAE
jgi:hypothetical protein